MEISAKRISGIVMATILAFPLVSCKGGSSPDKGPPGRPPEPAGVVGAQPESAKELDRRIAARVNGVPIPVHDLVREMNAIAPLHTQPGQKRDPKTDETIRKEALDRLIYRELAVQAARKEGMKAPPGAVAAEMKRIRAEMKTEDAFRQNLAESGTTEEELKRQIERGLLVDMITEKEVFGKVTVDLNQARKIYEERRKTYKGPSRPMTFEEARPLIERELMTAAVRKREDEWVGQMMKSARIEITPSSDYEITSVRK